MPRQAANGQFIKRLLLGVAIGLGLAFAFTAYAYQNNRLNNAYGESSYSDYYQNTLIKPNFVTNDLYEDWQKARLEKNRTGTWGGQCVTFAKKYLNVGGVWGYGGRNLSVNSGPQFHAVVLFGYSHVGVQIGESESQIQVIDSNSDWKQTIKIRWFDKDDPSIRGYHFFNN